MPKGPPGWGPDEENTGKKKVKGRLQKGRECLRVKGYVRRGKIGRVGRAGRRLQLHSPSVLLAAKIQRSASIAAA